MTPAKLFKAICLTIPAVGVLLACTPAAHAQYYASPYGNSYSYNGSYGNPYSSYNNQTTHNPYSAYYPTYSGSTGGLYNNPYAISGANPYLSPYSGVGQFGLSGIQQSAAAGMLTPGQTSNLLAKQNSLAKRMAKLLANDGGVLTPNDSNKINKEANDISQQFNNDVLNNQSNGQFAGAGPAQTGVLGSLLGGLGSQNPTNLPYGNGNPYYGNPSPYGSGLTSAGYGGVGSSLLGLLRNR